MPKLLQISIEVNSNSVGRIAEQIGQQAIETGWDSYITYARNNQPSKSIVIKTGNKLDIYWHGVMTRITDKHGFYSTLATKKLIKQINEIKPDVILLHHLHGYFINIEILFNYLSGIEIPIVWIFHDCWSFTGHCAHFDEIGCEKWKTQCYACPLTKSYPASYIFDRSKKNFIEKKKLFNSVKNLTVVPVSSWLGDLVKESFLSSNNIKVIHNGIDINTFRPSTNNQETREKFGLKDEFIVLGLSSVWNKSKGLDDFINLSTKVDSKVKLLLVGLSQKQIDDLPNNIIGISRTENVNQLVDIYSMSDLYLNLTYNDTFPTTNLESLACGTPILTYNTGGSIEAVSDDTGFIVEKGDLDSVIKIINEVKVRGKEFYIDKCRERAVACFNKDDRFNEYIELFTNLINKK